MKICYLASADKIHTQRWAKHFSKLGHQVNIISCHDSKEDVKIEGVEIIHLPPLIPIEQINNLGFIKKIVDGLNLILDLFRIRRRVDEISPDIVHAHYVTRYGLAGAYSGVRPFVATAWGTDVLIRPEESWVYRQVVRHALRRADLVTSMAPHMTELLVRRGYAPEEKIITLPFGVDTDVFNLDRRTRQHGNQPGIVVSTRRPDYGLDVDSFVRAVPAVMKAFENARFVVTGEGPLRKSIEQLAGDLGLSEHIEFRGEISHREMPELLGMADVFVSTSPSDGNNISLNEAMACGAFPVATDIPANRAWVESGKNGLLYPCRDVDQLADRIIEALQRPDWRQSVMSQNRDIIHSKASWANSMAKMESHYRRLLQEQR